MRKLIDETTKKHATAAEFPTREQIADVVKQSSDEEVVSAAHDLEVRSEFRCNPGLLQGDLYLLIRKEIETSTKPTST